MKVLLCLAILLFAYSCAGNHSTDSVDVAPVSVQDLIESHPRHATHFRRVCKECSMIQKPGVEPGDLCKNCGHQVGHTVHINFPERWWNHFEEDELPDHWRNYLVQTIDQSGPQPTLYQPLVPIPDPLFTNSSY